ncbi:MAG TPA: hypothetical protein P5551_06420 [Syntrophales bacterium]|jgi:Ca-activated chloride channel family protein|nr:hypothetical protein [Syntrophales bacterium]HRT61978.1 hypothetical protein [Syntrophales bacterium]
MIRSPRFTRIPIDFDGFKVCDVEPLSIPDVQAARPVIVFRKWWSDARSRMILSGVSGNGSQKVIEVNAVKPSKENAPSGISGRATASQSSRTASGSAPMTDVSGN